MTRSNLLTHLLTSVDRSPEKLTKVFGETWAEPMRGLIDLGLVIVHELKTSGRTIFYVASWSGKGDTTLRHYQTNGNSQEAH